MLSQMPKGSRALITGASSGIGAAYAQRLAAAGFAVTLVARRVERLEALADALGREHSVPVEVLPADLTNPNQLEAVENHLAAHPVALVVNNAGIGGYRPFVELDSDAAEEIIRLHVIATTRLTRAALPGMLERKLGAIVNVASLLALSGTLPPRPLPFRATYAGAKSFLVTFTQTLAGELSSTGVAVQACLPGLVATEFHSVQNMDVGRVPRMAPEDVVTASLSSLEQGEILCVPGLEDASLLERLGAVQREVMAKGNVSALAQRYRPKEQP